jgi:hypothetical protein
MSNLLIKRRKKNSQNQRNEKIERKGGKFDKTGNLNKKKDYVLN